LSNFTDVKLFHDVFEVENRDTPSFPDQKTCDLRIELIREEFLDELVPAIEAHDIVAVADALTDILYVTYGAGLAFGIDLDACFAEVQRSNMSKLGADGKPIRRADGKVLKGTDYSPPDLKKILDNQ
jgi:predicted HAD superfamily Cof-like phosphohydrolase